MDIDLLSKKFAQAKRALQRVQEYLPTKEDEFIENHLSQDVAYRNFVIAVQNCVDMGSYIVSSKGWPIPAKMKEIFETLSGQKVIPPALAKKLIHAVTLRNTIVHNYAELDHRKAYRLIKQSLKFVPQFCLKLINKKARK